MHRSWYPNVDTVYIGTRHALTSKEVDVQRVLLHFAKLGKVPTLWFQGTYAHLQYFLPILKTTHHVRDAVPFQCLPDVLSQSPCGMQRCSPALMMMTDHYTIGVMPVSSSQRPQKPSRTWFQSCKCLVVRHLWGSVQESKRKLRNLYIYASSYMHSSSLYIRDTALHVKVRESLGHLGQWLYKSLIINDLSVSKKCPRRGFASWTSWTAVLIPAVIIVTATSQSGCR